MLHQFLRKKRKSSSKAVNIESIQSHISQVEQHQKVDIIGNVNTIINKSQSKQCEQPNNSLAKEDNSVKIHETTDPYQCKKAKAARMFKNLEDYSFVSENENCAKSIKPTSDKNFIVGTSEVISRNEKSELCSLSDFQYQSDVLNEKPANKETKEDINLRKMKVMNNATRNIQISYSMSTAALYLPKAFKELSTLYKIISSVHAFNQKRGLTLVFVKYVDSIERLFKHRVEIEMLEKLNFVCKDAIRFTPLTIFDEGENKKTFTIDIKGDFDIDMSLFNFLIEEYGKWLDDQAITERVSRFHPDFLTEEILIPKKPFLFNLEAQPKVLKDIKQVVKSKSDSIIERIKEKERLRKEQFIKECTVERDYFNKIDSLFVISNKKAMKLEDIVFSIGGFDCKSQILKSLKDRFVLKHINGADFIVKKEE